MKSFLFLLTLHTLTSFAMGQSLTISQTGPSPSYVVAGQSSLTITVTNIGGAAAAGATIQEAIPPGMNLIGASGTNWTCSSTIASDPVGTITCTYSSTIAASGGTANPLTINVQPRRSIMSNSPANNISVDPSGGTSPPAASSCTALNTPTAGCGTPLSSDVPVAQSNVHMGPQSNPDSTIMHNMLTNREHYDHTTWPEPNFSTLSGNIVVISPKAIKNTGNIPWSFGLVQGNKSADEADTPNVTYFTGGAGGIFFDNAQDITTEVSFNNGATWTLLKSASGLPSSTTNLTRNIHTIDPINVPFNNLVVQPGQTVNFLARHTFPNARYTGRKNVTTTMYIGLYMPGTQTSLFSEGFTNLTSARTWSAIPNGATGAWGGSAPTNEIFESTGDTIITGSVDIQKSQATTNGTGLGAASDVVSGSLITYTLTITGKLPNTTPNPSLTAGPWDRIERFPVQSSGVSITENGNTSPNNWASWTDAVPGSASCSVGATITGDTTAYSTYTFSLTSPVAAGQIVTCTFQRKVK
ncbi:MAG: DUF11 domain-containing protein [Acidobacteria bacterium]|nr:DUF11 domain-containing protein [Acidobacteriota bacterium]